MKKTTSKIYVEQEKENPQRKKSQSKKVKKTAQDTIPFDEIYDNGIFRIGDTYSLIFIFQTLIIRCLKIMSVTAYTKGIKNFLTVCRLRLNIKNLLLIQTLTLIIM